MINSRMINVLDNADVSLVCYPDLKTVHHTMHRFIAGETFQNLLMSGFDVYKQYNCRKWLSDDRSSTALRQADLDWAEEHFHKPMVEFGWDYWAMVMPSQILGQLNRKRVVERNKEIGVTSEVFSDLQEAMDWLIKQP